MSKDYQINWSAHPNIYNQYSERTYNIYFSEPATGVNSETGLLLLIPGFGGNANSNVYKKMRREFADRYNLVTIQCDYFGQEFMQGPKRFHPPPQSLFQKYFSQKDIIEIFKNGFDLPAFLRIASNYDLSITAPEHLDESMENFNDMGIMQALDNITAVCYVMQILRDNHLSFNAKRIVIYGNSHGSYLGYLCNALAPSLFSYLIDNSSWLFPSYLNSTRFVSVIHNNFNLEIGFQYLASTLPYDTEILDLTSLYKKINNTCEINCFHGTTDSLISHMDKRRFCETIPYTTFHEISSDKVDGLIFKSTNHGLDSDFLAHFHHAMHKKEFDYCPDVSIATTTIQTTQKAYTFNYDHGIPLLTISQ